MPLIVSDARSVAGCYGDDCIASFLSQFPTKFTVFLPYLASRCTKSRTACHNHVAGIIQELSLRLPSPQKRELGEMIARIYCDVKDPEVRRGLVDALYDIGQNNPDFMSDFSDVFAQACRDPDSYVRKRAQVGKTMTILTSVESVDAINEVFWDQSVEVKRELLVKIERESMTNAETAELAMEMAANCLEVIDSFLVEKAHDVLLYVTRFRSLSNRVLCCLLHGRFISQDYTLKEIMVM